MRDRTKAARSGSISTPNASRPSDSATTSVVPKPANGSSTASPGSVNRSTKKPTSCFREADVVICESGRQRSLVAVIEA